MQKPKRTYKRPEGSEYSSGESDVIDAGQAADVDDLPHELPPSTKATKPEPNPLEVLKANLAKAYPQAVPRQLAHGLLASLARYPEETLKLNMPRPLHVEANEHTISWLMAVVCELAQPDEQE